jgi:hypothetical protein
VWWKRQKVETCFFFVLLFQHSAYALSAMSKATAGQSYQDARRQGLDVSAALPYAVAQGMVEYGTEKIPMLRLLGDLKVGSSFFRTLAAQVAMEVPGEQLATVLQNLNEWAALPENRDKSVRDYLAARPGAAAETLVATLIGAGGQVSVMKGVEQIANGAIQREQRARNADESARVMEQMNNLTQASRVLQRDPQTFAEFIADAAQDGNVRHVFIDGNALLQSGLAEPLSQVSPSIAEQLPTAARTGGAVAIPVEEYATTIAPTEYAQPLLEHLRVEPEGFSRAEATEYLQSQAQILEEEIARQEARATRSIQSREQQETVRGVIRAQLDETGRFLPEVRDAYSRLTTSFYSVMADRMAVCAANLPPLLEPRRKDSRSLVWQSQMQQSLCRLRSCTQGEVWGGACSRGTGTRVRCKLNRRKPFIGRNPPLILPFTGGKASPSCEGGLGEDSSAFPDRQAILDLEKPAMAYLLEINVTLTSSTLDRTRWLWQKTAVDVFLVRSPSFQGC